ncbi:MAG: hypothetical protein ACRDP4_15780 [Nocardioidaceae bacterium]
MKVDGHYDVADKVLKAKIGARAPVVAEQALSEAVAELQDAAIQLHNGLLGNCPDRAGPEGEGCRSQRDEQQ